MSGSRKRVRFVDESPEPSRLSISLVPSEVSEYLDDEIRELRAQKELIKKGGDEIKRQKALIRVERAHIEKRRLELDAESADITRREQQMKHDRTEFTTTKAELTAIKTELTTTKTELTTAKMDYTETKSELIVAKAGATGKAKLIRDQDYVRLTNENARLTADLYLANDKLDETLQLLRDLYAGNHIVL